MTVRSRRIYLDHNATAPLLPEAKAALSDALDLVGNPSSVHEEGRQSRALVEDARRAVADLLGATASGVVFTSGATEAANTCLTPDWVVDGAEIHIASLAVSDADHPATRDGGRFGDEAVNRLAVDAAGLLRMDALDEWLGGISRETWSMLCLTLANSETGVVQDIPRIAGRLEGRKVAVVVDASQAAGRLDLRMCDLGADAVLLSGHKLGAAKGVGAYVLRDEARRPMPLLRGGGQEMRRRAGTEAVPLIASFGAAARVAAKRLAGDRGSLLRLRERLVAALDAGGARLRIVGAEAPRLPNTVAVAASGLRAETAQIALDLEGFAVSSGSACSSGKVGPSHVLKAMHDGGLAIDPSEGAIRVSLGYETTERDIDLFAEALLRLLLRAERRGDGLRAA